MNSIKKSKNNLHSHVIVLACFFAVALLASCGAQTETVVEETEIVFAVNAYEVSQTVLSDYLEFGGDVIAASSVDIFPDATGKISRLYVSVGDYVYRDQVLAEIDPSRPGMTYSTNPVKAPMQGTVSSLPLPVGSTVSPSMSMGKISSTGVLEIKGAVAERFVSKVELGQAATLMFDAWPGENFSAVISEVSPVLDPSARTMGITLRLSPFDSRIKPGMYARIKLITQEIEDAVVIPYDAIVIRNNVTCVFVVEENSTVRLQEVDLGLRVDNRVEITAGLQGGDLVVTGGKTLLDNGTAVSVISVETDSNSVGGN
ncbi:MAG: efflux RND transporter periplasmic adaptor subunit [Spirochaetales bacterium]